MPCRIKIPDIEVLAYIGCTNDERREPQPLRILADIKNPGLYRASLTDRIEDTIDAEELRALIVKVATEARVQTLERLGQLIEDQLRARFPMPHLAWRITVNKPKFGWSYVHSWST